MSRVLVIPDAHLKIETIEKGLELADLFMATHVVMLGDYFDDWDAIPDQYHRMLDYLKTKLATHPNLFPLLGNHELSYMGYPCAGHNRSVAPMLGSFLKNDKRFWTCMALDGVMYSHAGFTEGWLKNNSILTENEMRYKLLTGGAADLVEDKTARREENKAIFSQVGPERGGHCAYPSPLWADLKELLADSAGNMKQVVGHTPVASIQHFNNIWFCDTQSNGNECDEYLLVVDGNPEIINYNIRLEDERRLKRWG